MTVATTLAFEGLMTHLKDLSAKRIARESSAVALGIDEETRRFWSGNAGNAKARRRWRRRNIPNSQRGNMGAMK